MKSLILITLLIGLAAAEDIFNNTKTDLAESNSTDIVEGRRRGGFGHHSSLLWFGWAHALAILWVIKIKVFFVGIGLGWAALVAYKYFAKQNCFHSSPEIYHDSSHFDTSAYSNTPPPTGWSGGSSSYEGPDPYSAFSSDIHSGHSFDSTGFSDHDHHDYHDHDHHDHDYHDHDQQDFSSGPSDMSSADPSIAPTTAAKMRRSVPNQEDPFDDIDFAEIMFIFLGVKTPDCKKRFMCEMEFRSRENPLTKLMHGFAKETFFRQFEPVDENEVKSYADCARVYSECRAPGETDGESNDVDDVDDEDDNDLSETSTNQITNDENNKLEEKSNVNLRNKPIAMMQMLMKSVGR